MKIADFTPFSKVFLIQLFQGIFECIFTLQESRFNLAITICMVLSDILLFSYTHNSLPIPFQEIVLHF